KAANGCPNNSGLRRRGGRARKVVDDDQNAKTVGENDVALVVVRRDALGVGRAARRIEGEDRDLTALLREEAVVEKARLREREADAAPRRAVADIGKLMPADRGMQRHARHLG